MFGLARRQQTWLVKLDAVQARALRIIGKTTALQTLHAHRTVAATAYLLKLRYTIPAARVRSLLPLPFTPPNVVRARGQERTAYQHPWQLCHQLQRNCPNYLKRSFPYSNTSFWNSLPVTVFPVGASFYSFESLLKSNITAHLMETAYFILNLLFYIHVIKVVGAVCATQPNFGSRELVVARSRRRSSR